MRIAIAGTGGLACLIARVIDEDTSHHAIFLSRSPQPQLVNNGYQVALVDYNDADTLRFALRGIDTVVSTVTGPNQIELIKAAANAHVRRFIPAEFEGPPESRSAEDDRGRTDARHLLTRFSRQMQSTIFVCGIFYERFQPGGLARIGIGLGSATSGEGNYILNCRSMTAVVPAYNANQEPNVTICMTAVQDVARYVCMALELPNWPAQIRMYGLRISLNNLVDNVQRLRGSTFTAEWHSPYTLRSALQDAVAQRNTTRQSIVRGLISTAEGRYDFAQTNLGHLFSNPTVTSFDAWFAVRWNSQ
ncbi:Hypothetical predicted protein [Lecanosticta acicola]|uniref:NAD(P)-binding domain-containing protein n=1 Tax=Lecanosticta acicola TaxID=111012 RepID=A0AAI8Z176_9PEZI|nr:Hypothetical predicted protein [Lecanosticta acicola]